MKVEVIGVQKGTYQDKNGKTKEMSNIFFKQPFNEYESDREGMNCDGFKTGGVFINKIVDAQAGDVVNLEYEPGFQEKATLVDVTVLQKAKGRTSATAQA